MATHSSVLAWRIPGTGEPGGLPSMGSHRVGHDWSDLTTAAADPLFPSLCVLSPFFLRFLLEWCWHFCLSFISNSPLLLFISSDCLDACWNNSSTWTSSLQIQTLYLLFPGPQWEWGYKPCQVTWRKKSDTNKTVSWRLAGASVVSQALASIMPSSSPPHAHPQLLGPQDSPEHFSRCLCYLADHSRDPSNLPSLL